MVLTPSPPVAPEDVSGRAAAGRSGSSTVRDSPVSTIAALIALALALHLWGLRRDLPYTPEVDEPFLVEPALRIAYSGDWNPRWFMYPGSTIIYPLAAGYRLWFAAVHGGPLRGENPDLQRRFLAAPGEYYLPARLLPVGYAVGAIVLVFVLGRMVFGGDIGLVAAIFALLCPLALDMARQVRSDSAATFFGLLWLILAFRVLERPTVARHLLAGAVAGLAIATRYIMAVLMPIFLAVDGLVVRRGGRRTGVVAGLLAVPAAFLVTTPYLVLDLPTARASFVQGAGWQLSGHLGADGLSALGNAWFYLSDALPSAATPVHALLAVVGLAVVLVRRETRSLLLVAYAALFLVAISTLALHWARWTLPILPIVWVLAAVGLSTVIGAAGGPLLGPRGERVLLFGAVLALSAGPAVRAIDLSRLHANPSTRVLAREWLLANVPANTRLAQESYAAPLRGAPFVLEEPFSLAQMPFEYYRKRRFRYLIVSDAVYGRYDAEPGRYAAQVAFYRDLAARATLRQEFVPSPTRGGPVIRIYEVSDAANTASDSR